MRSILFHDEDLIGGAAVRNPEDPNKYAASTSRGCGAGPPRLSYVLEFFGNSMSLFAVLLLVCHNKTWQEFDFFSGNFEVGLIQRKINLWSRAANLCAVYSVNGE